MSYLSAVAGAEGHRQGDHGSKAIADIAYEELINRTDWPAGAKRLGVAFTQDGKQLAYHNFKTNS